MTAASEVPHGHRAVIARPVALRERHPRVRDVLPGIVGQLPTAIAVLKSDGSVGYRNEAASAVFGFPEGDAPVRMPPLVRLDGTPYEPGADPVSLAMAQGIVTANVDVAVRDDGGMDWVIRLTAAPVLDDQGNVVGAVAYGEPLERSLDTERLHEAFLGVLAHELRTPVTAIYGGSQLLLNEGISSESRASVLSDIAAEAEQLHQRIEDFLAIARAERGINGAGHEPLSLPRLVALAIAREERRSPDRRMELTVAPDTCPVSGDEAYVIHVLRNIIGNAVAWSPPPSVVEIEIRDGSGMVEVQVKDRGPGFPAGVGDDAFQLFYRNPRVGGQMPRSGLGLYVARALVEAMGGFVWLRDREGGGSEIGFALASYDPRPAD